MKTYCKSVAIVCLLLGVLVMVGAGEGMAAEAVLERNQNVSVTASPELTRSLIAAISSLSTQMEGLLHQPAARTPRLTVSVAAGVPLVTEGMRLQVPDDAPADAVLHRLALQLLRRQFQAAVGAEGRGGAVVRDATLDWWAAALVYRHRSGYDGGYGGVARNRLLALSLFRNGRCPALEAVVNLPPPEGSVLAYELYARHCHLLAVILERGGNRNANLLPQLFVPVAGSAEPPMQALLQGLGAQVVPPQTLQGWYVQQAHRLLAGGVTLRQERVEWVAGRVAELESVAAVAPDARGGFGSQPLPLDQLGDRLESYALDHQALSRRQDEFVQLLRQAPPTLRPALNQYIQALAELNAGKVSKFKKEFKAAREAFAKAQKSLVSAGAWLDGLDAQLSGGVFSNWGYYRQVLQESRRQRQAFNPTLSAFLDQAEAEW